MAIIENLMAINDIAHGDATFKVYGTVTVASPAIEPILVESEVRHKGGWELLELKMVDTGAIAPQVLTEKTVAFERAGGTAWNTVEVVHPEGVQRCEIRTLEAID